MTDNSRLLVRLAVLLVVLVSFEIAAIGGVLCSSQQVLGTETGAALIVDAAKTVVRVTVTVINAAGKVMSAVNSHEEDEESGGSIFLPASAQADGGEYDYYWISREDLHFSEQDCCDETVTKRYESSDRNCCEIVVQNSCGNCTSDLHQSI
jgi:hypothetical protein